MVKKEKKQEKKKETRFMNCLLNQRIWIASFIPSIILISNFFIKKRNFFKYATQNKVWKVYRWCISLNADYKKKENWIICNNDWRKP